MVYLGQIVYIQWTSELDQMVFTCLVQMVRVHCKSRPDGLQCTADLQYVEKMVYSALQIYVGVMVYSALQI
jgi:hypothetical protein